MIDENNQIPANNGRPENTVHETTDLVDIVGENIESIVDLHMRSEKRISHHQRVIEAVTANLGRPRFFYLILLFVARKQPPKRDKCNEPPYLFDIFLNAQAYQVVGNTGYPGRGQRDASPQAVWGVSPPSLAASEDYATAWVGTTVRLDFQGT